MFNRNVRLSLGSGSALLLLAACSGGSSTSGSAVPVLSQSQQVRQAAVMTRVVDATTGRMGLPTGFHGLLAGVRERSPGWMSADAKSASAKIYVSDAVANAVYIYNAKKPGSPIGTITTGMNEPLGNFVDPKGDLYVSQLGSNSVTVYPKGKTSPSKTYTSGLVGPIGVVVGKDGTLYVSEFESSTVVEYDKGKTSPSRTLAVNESEGVALDSKNNLYVSYINPNSGTGDVLKFAPKSTSGTDLGISVGFSGDVKLDKSNDILLEDQDAPSIDFFKPGSSSPYGSISVTGDAYKLALNKAESLAYVATASNLVGIYAAKPSGQSVGSITSGLQEATGVTLTPEPPFDY